MELLFFLGMFFGQHCGYTLRVEMRGDNPIIQSRIQNVITTLTFPSWISIMAWGFINMKWYIVILTFLIIALVLTPIVFKRERLYLIFKYKTFTELTLLFCAILIWGIYFTI